MTIPTVASIRAARRFQDRRRAAAARVITKMMRGGSLHVTFMKRKRRNGSVWTPTTPQTWRYVES